MNWGIEDYAAALVLVLLSAAGLALIKAKVHRRSRQLILSVGIVGVILLVWAEIAVGIF